MCLESVKRVYVLKRDLKVKKVVCCVSKFNPLYTGAWWGTVLMEGLNINPNPYKKCRTGFGGKLYNLGFHCFSKRESDSIIEKKYNISWDLECIIEITIPKGTEVIYGIDSCGLRCYVTDKFVFHGSYEDTKNSILNHYISKKIKENESGYTG